MTKKTVGMLAATAAAGLFSAAPVIAGPKVVDGHYCANNACKGKSACGGYGNKNGCSGANECKGQGWLKQGDKTSCEANGGKWAKKAKAPAKTKKKPAKKSKTY